MKIRSVLFLALAFIPILAMASVTERDFSLFAETPPKKFGHPALQTEDAFAKKYKAVLTKELKAGANFAGKYRLVQIGCGSGCSQLAVIDCQSGMAYDTKILVTDSPGHHDMERIQFRNNSRLIVAAGCLNEKKEQCGYFHLEWAEETLKKISFSPFR